MATIQNSIILNDRMTQTFTAINNAVIITAYDSKSVTVYDINTASIQKIDINEAQSIFNNTQNDFSCFFTFRM